VTHRIVELRRYALRGGQRDTLIELFDREFVESQEALGMAILGQFRDLDDSDQFVWVRAFPAMDTRPHSLGAFYTGPVWKSHGAAANATMESVDDVLLLAPVAAYPRLASLKRDQDTDSVVLIDIHHSSPAGDVYGFVDGLAGSLADAGAQPLWLLQTEHSNNNFPALPVRANVSVIVYVVSFPTLDALDGWLVATAAPPWPVERLRLRPTRRSILR
jgi:hypothetical protein